MGVFPQRAGPELDEPLGRPDGPEGRDRPRAERPARPGPAGPGHAGPPGPSSLRIGAARGGVRPAHSRTRLGGCSCGDPGSVVPCRPHRMPAAGIPHLVSSRGIVRNHPGVAGTERGSPRRDVSAVEHRSRLLGSRDGPGASSRAQDGWPTYSGRSRTAMRVRSWMAALALIGASSIVIGRGLSAQGTGGAQEPSAPKAAAKTQDKAAAGSPKGEKPESGSPPEKRRDSGANVPAIELKLAIAGLGTEGCDVEVKPANPSCKFRPSPSKHVASDGSRDDRVARRRAARRRQDVRRGDHRPRARPDAADDLSGIPDHVREARIGPELQLLHQLPAGRGRDQGDPQVSEMAPTSPADARDRSDPGSERGALNRGRPRTRGVPS